MHPAPSSRGPATGPTGARARRRGAAITPPSNILRCRPAMSTAAPAANSTAPVSRRLGTLDRASAAIEQPAAFGGVFGQQPVRVVGRGRRADLVKLCSLVVGQAEFGCLEVVAELRR